MVAADSRRDTVVRERGAIIDASSHVNDLVTCITLGLLRLVKWQTCKGLGVILSQKVQRQKPALLADTLKLWTVERWKFAPHCIGDQSKVCSGRIQSHTHLLCCCSSSEVASKVVAGPLRFNLRSIKPTSLSLRVVLETARFCIAVRSCPASESSLTLLVLMRKLSLEH